MAEYIEREALLDALYDADVITFTGIKILEKFPAADVQSVIRCKDCIYSKPNEISGGCICRIDNSSHTDWFFCATGMRKTI